MGDTLRQQWSYVGGAVLLHALLVAGIYLLALASPPKPVQGPQLAIQAFVVQNFPTTLRVDPAQQERERLAAERLAQERAQAEREQQEREQRERDAATAKQLEVQQAREAQARREQAKAEEARLAAIKREQEVAERKAREVAEKAEAERKRKEAAEQQRLAELARQREEAERKDQEAREADFKSSLAAEEERMAAASSGKLNEYIALIEQSIVRNWIRPPSARSGLECQVKVSQAQSGTVLSVRIGACNGDSAVKQSIEAAVYRASPLPPPPDPRLFERNLLVVFRPRD